MRFYVLEIFIWNLLKICWVDSVRLFWWSLNLKLISKLFHSVLVIRKVGARISVQLLIFLTFYWKVQQDVVTKYRFVESSQAHWNNSQGSLLMIIFAWRKSEPNNLHFWEIGSFFRVLVVWFVFVCLLNSIFHRIIISYSKFMIFCPFMRALVHGNAHTQCIL